MADVSATTEEGQCWLDREELTRWSDPASPATVGWESPLHHRHVRCSTSEHTAIVMITAGHKADCATPPT